MTILLVAGGSGGHVFPAIAVAEASRRQQMVLLTDTRGDNFLRNDRHLFASITVLPSQNKWNGAPLFHSLKCILTHRPDAVIGFGGQMTLLPLLCARAFRIPCAIHQSDTLMGKANRWLAPFVQKIFLSHPHTLQKKSHKVAVVGTPVRAAFHAIAPLTPCPPLCLLILGGSQGAHIWSVLMPQAFALLSAKEKQSFTLIQQCRIEDISCVKQAYDQMEMNVTLTPFIENMSQALSWCHLVFTRAGASTIAELTAAGRPAFFIPYPHATQDHQFHNAHPLVRHEGAWMSRQEDTTPQSIALFLKNCLYNPQKLLYAGEKLKSLSRPNAAIQLSEFFNSWR